MKTAWLYLILGGVFEIGWPLGFKLAQMLPHRLLWIGVAVVSMGLSGFFLYEAQRSIPIGTAYLVWTGIGASRHAGDRDIILRRPCEFPEDFFRIFGNSGYNRHKSRIINVT